MKKKNSRDLQRLTVARLLDQATDALPYARSGDISFWVKMLRHQLDEVRDHLGNRSMNTAHRLEKAHNELVDVLGVAWSALHHLSVHPKQTIVKRTRNVIRRKKHIRAKYDRLYGGRREEK